MFVLSATMTKIIKEMLPADVRVARDAQDLLIECCVEFINLISSESNEVCNKEDKRTIAPEHVLKALQVWCYIQLSLIHLCEIYTCFVILILLNTGSWLWGIRRRSLCRV
jgi:histone H3/H4